MQSVLLLLIEDFVPPTAEDKMKDNAEGRRVDLLSLRKLALEKLRKRSALREVLLQERDDISAAEYLAKIPIWLALLRLEGTRNGE